MTIYSGFATRKLQERYNILITQLFELMSQLIITYIQRSKIEPFENKFRKLYTNMEKMDGLKHLQPKFSSILRPLSEHILFIDDRPSTVPQGVILNIQNNQKRRPMTSNNFIQQRRSSLQFQRKTINVIPERNGIAVQRYNKRQKNKIKHQSFSVKHSENYAMYRQQKMKQPQIVSNLTMQQLMEKNRLVQRKMTLFRKKKQTQPVRISKIPQCDEEQDASFM